MAKAHIFVGGTGTGKTTDVKKLVSEFKGKGASNSQIMIYDVNKEYFKNYKLPAFADFTKEAQKSVGKLIVFEEATIFLSNRGTSDEVRDVLVRKRHTNCYIVFVFHSLRAVPRWLFDLSNYITIHKTNDSPKKIEQRFEHEALTDAFNEVRDHENKFYSKKIDIY